jgi:hypothetical protein
VKTTFLKLSPLALALGASLLAFANTASAADNGGEGVSSVSLVQDLTSLIEWLDLKQEQVKIDEDAETVSGGHQTAGAKAAALTPKAVCIGDNNLSGGACFKSFRVSNDARNFAWEYKTGSGFYLSDALVTTRWGSVPGWPSSAATWTFITPVSGDVWFSAWIPSTNATAHNVYYNISCGNGGGAKGIDQYRYSAQWVTLLNIGYVQAGATCTVNVDKGPDADEISTGKRFTKMAVDGMKMTIY